MHVLKACGLYGIVTPLGPTEVEDAVLAEQERAEGAAACGALPASASKGLLWKSAALARAMARMEPLRLCKRLALAAILPLRSGRPHCLPASMLATLLSQIRQPRRLPPAASTAAQLQALRRGRTDALTAQAWGHVRLERELVELKARHGLQHEEPSSLAARCGR